MKDINKEFRIIKLLYLILIVGLILIMVVGYKIANASTTNDNTNKQYETYKSIADYSYIKGVESSFSSVAYVNENYTDYIDKEYGKELVFEIIEKLKVTDSEISIIVEQVNGYKRTKEK